MYVLKYIRKWQDKCRERRSPLYIVLIGLTKVFDTVSKQALYKVLNSIGCFPSLLQLVIPSHKDMKACVQFDGNTSDLFKVRGGVKQGCVLVPTPCDIFAALFHHSFNGSENGVYHRTRLDGFLFHLKRLKSKRLTTEVLIRELIFGDDAVLTAHSEATLKSLIDSLVRACHVFTLSITVKKSEATGHRTDSAPEIELHGDTLKMIAKFIYLGPHHIFHTFTK